MNIVSFEDIKKECQTAQNRVKELSKLQSECDKIENEILHKLEDIKISASQGYKISKSLQDVRIKRRDVKNELSKQQTIANLLKPFVKGYETNQNNIRLATINGKKKYGSKNLEEINMKISKL